MNTRRMKIIAGLAVLALAGRIMAAPRDVQIRSINLDAGTIELHNFGAGTESLSGWQFCTFDENDIFRYTATTGMNGLSIDPGQSLYIHVNNDAPAVSHRVNLSTLGGFFASPFDATAYAMSLYGAGVGFIDPARMVDHLMWNIGGVPGPNSGRASVAVSAGLWTSTGDWIDTAAGSARIKLTDGSGGLLHGPSDYDVVIPLANPIPTPIAPGSVNVVLQTIATGLTAPNWGRSAPGQQGRLFVSDQSGVLWAIDLATGNKSAFLDVSSSLVTLGIFGPNSFDERGLLGFAFHPDYASNGLLYTYTSEPVSGTADFSTMPIGQTANHQAVITEWAVPDPTNPASVVNLGSARELLRIDQPQFNHNAGALEFGGDGKLYLSLGDGGGADDVDDQDFLGAPIIGHGQGNGQDPSNVLGTILRIDPSGSNSANGSYGVPADNPFVGSAGFVEEIFAYGFRNPFRFSFDSVTGYLWVGDVGQNHVEEIDIVVAGSNYGWNFKEGTFFFDANDVASGFVRDVDPGVPAGLADPVAQYDHDEGLAIIGGFVYRGVKVPALVGRYVFGDFARTFSNDGRLFYLDQSNQVLEMVLVGQPALNLALLGFGQDADGEVYVLANSNGIPFGNTGVVLRIVLLAGDADADGDVDLTDYGVLFNCIAGPVAAPPPGCAHMDLNMDGVVDLRDFAEFQRSFTG